MTTNKYKQAVKEVANDPGFGIAVVCTLLFWSTNPVGIAACVTASGLIAGMKALDVIDPDFMKKSPRLEAMCNNPSQPVRYLGQKILQAKNKLREVAKDPRTPLRTLGCALLLVMGATLSINATNVWSTSDSLMSFIEKGWLTAILPAVSSTVFAICDFKYASAISESMKGAAAKVAEKTKGFANTLKAAFKRPELWGATGMAMMLLMTGGAGVAALPLVGAAFVISTLNLKKDRPPHTGHPNLYFAASVIVTGVIAAATAQPLLCAAYLIDAYYLARIEALTTPGGARQVWQDVKDGAHNLVGKVTLALKGAEPEIVCAPSTTRGEPALAGKALSGAFPQPVSAKAQPASPAVTIQPNL